MNTSRFRSARLAFLALLVLPLAISATGDEKASPAAPQDRLAAVTAGTLSIDFPGGPLSQLVTRVNGAGEPALSIIQPAGLDPVLPAFSVRNARIDALTMAMNQLVEPQGFALITVGPNLAVLREAPWTKPSQGFTSLQIRTKLGEQPLEEFIATLRAACEFAHPDQKASTLRFKYHPGTGLLFVAGTSPEVDVAIKVFGSLPDASPIKSPPSAPQK